MTSRMVTTCDTCNTETAEQEVARVHVSWWEQNGRPAHSLDVCWACMEDMTKNAVAAALLEKRRQS